MGIGVSIFFIAAGLIMALAVDYNLTGIDIQFVGWVLAIVGVLGLLMTTLVWGRRSTTAAPRDEVVEERRIR